MWRIENGLTKVCQTTWNHSKVIQNIFLRWFEVGSVLLVPFSTSFRWIFMVFAVLGSQGRPSSRAGSERESGGFWMRFLWLWKDFIDFWRIFEVFGGFRRCPEGFRRFSEGFQPGGKPRTYRFYWYFLIFLILERLGQRLVQCRIQWFSYQNLMKIAVDLDKGSGKCMKPPGTTSK